MYSKTLIPAWIFVAASCTGRSANQPKMDQASLASPFATVFESNPYSALNKIPLPEGYTIEEKQGSFADWLLKLKLKKDKTVYLYNGAVKTNQAAQFAVLDITAGNKDLQQCADAIMRLRAEYLFEAKDYQAIRFTDNENNAYQFNQPYTKEHLHHYLQQVFGMCGSASLAKQMFKTEMSAIKAGDVFIRGGFPGHAVMVMAVAQNNQLQKIFLLAQSYMPAQDIHILVIPLDKNGSPWYEVNADELIETPEYIFKRTELKLW